MAFIPLNTKVSLGGNYNSVNDALRTIENKLRFINTPSKDWTAPTLQNSWVNYGAGFSDAGYRKDATGMVYLRGLIKSGTIGAAALTLPVGFRPSSLLLVGTISNDAIGRIQIASSGTVTPTAPSNNAWVSLDGITFLAEQ